LSPGTEDAFFFERYLSQLELMREVLEVSGFRHRRHVVDVGAHIGGWSWVLSQWCEQVNALDVSEAALELGDRFAQLNSLDNIVFRRMTPAAAAALPPADGMLCLVTFQVMRAGELETFFASARRILVPGGRLLCNSVTPWMVLEWLLTGSRIRLDGWRFQLVWARDCLRGLLTRRIDPTRAYYCLRPAAVIDLASRYSFRLVRAPRWYRGIRATRALEISNAGDMSHRFRHYDWYLFEWTREGGGGP